MTDEVRAVCFPHDDQSFVLRVQELVRAPAGGDLLQPVVEAMLRETYPLAVISGRLPMAAVDGKRVWYVYRDGTFLRRPSADAP